MRAFVPVPPVSWTHPLTFTLKWGIFVAFFLLGGVIGGFIGAPLASNKGRIPILKYNNISFIVGGCILALSSTKEVLYLARFIIGIGAGIATAVVPLYISEITSSHQRGTMGSLHQLSIVIGVLASLTFGVGLSDPDHWRILYFLTVVPALTQFWLLWFCVESPK